MKSNFVNFSTLVLLFYFGINFSIAQTLTRPTFSTAGKNATNLVFTIGEPFAGNLYQANGSLQIGAQPGEDEQNITILYAVNNGYTSGAIWSLSRVGPGLPITHFGGFKSTISLVVINGVTVVADIPMVCNHLTIENNGQIYRNSANLIDLKIINVYGNLTVNGDVGNGNTFDALGFTIEGNSCNVSGVGNFNPAHIGKNTSTSLVTNVTLNMNTKLWIPSGGAIFNNGAAVELDINVPFGKTLSIMGVNSTVCFDGLTGAAATENGGALNVNGSLIVKGKIIAVTNNSILNTSYNFAAGSIVSIENMDADPSNPRAVISFSPTASISITGVLKVINGTLNSNNVLTFISTPTQTALIDGSGAGNISGNITMQRKTTSPFTGYHYLSSCVTPSFVNTPNGWGDDFSINAGLDNWIYDPNGGPYGSFPNVWEYNETDLNPDNRYGWVSTQSATDPITTLKGFACYMPANTLVDVYGAPNNGPYSYPLTNASDGFNLIGNPYPSPMSWNSFRGHNPLLNAAYSAFISTGGYVGNYGAYNGIVGTLGVNNLISSSQSFFVVANTAGAVHSLNTDRTTDLGPLFFNNPILPDLLKITSSLNGSMDETLIYFDANATNNFDNNSDARKLFTQSPSVSSVYTMDSIFTEKYTINALGNFNNDLIIPIGVLAGSNGILSLNFSGMESFSPSASIYLEDNLNGTYQNLGLNSSYQVNLNLGFNEGRLFIHFLAPVSIVPAFSTCTDLNASVTFNNESVMPVQVTCLNQNLQTVFQSAFFTGTWCSSPIAPGNYQINMERQNGEMVIDYFTIDPADQLDFSVVIPETGQINTALSFAAATNGTTAIWNFGDGQQEQGNNVFHTYSSPGNYLVESYSSLGLCNQNESHWVHIMNPNGMNENENQHIKLEINMHNTNLYLFCNENIDNATITLFDALGEKIAVWNQNIPSGPSSYTLPTIAAGFYSINIQNNHSFLLKKSIVYVN